MNASPLETWQRKNPCVMCQMCCEALQQIMKTSLQTRKKTFRTSAAKTAHSKPTGWSSSHPNRKPSSSFHDCHRILRKARRAPLRKSQTRGKGTSRLPAFTKLRRSEKLSKEFGTANSKGNSANFCNKMKSQHLPPFHPDSPRKNTSKRQQQKTAKNNTTRPTPWSEACARRWNEWRSSFLPR